MEVHMLSCTVEEGSKQSGILSREKECNLTVLAIKYFSSFLSLGYTLSSIKQQLPKDRNKEVHRGPAFYSFRSEIARDLEEHWDTLGMSYRNLGSSINH
jgi:hypothetical protein